MKIIELESVDSTNEFIKRSDCGKDLTVCALSQTAGRGTKGRSFVSDKGGLYVSVLRHYKDFKSENAFKIMVNACVAVCKTVEFFGLKPVIRWANDVLVNGKKICGTLIENVFSGSYISRSVVGVGLNVNNALPPELKDIAASFKSELGRETDINEVRRILLKNLSKNYGIKEYKSYINWFGADVALKTSDGEFAATALDIDFDGKLICIIGGSMKKISSAEVSLRL